MRSRLRAVTGVCTFALTSLLTLATGCRMPGATHIETVERPESVTDFNKLFSQNCSGCHGANGQNGPAIDLANPVYQAWVSDATLERIISGGEPPTQMPAFAQSSGGMLTDAQIDALVKGMRASWATSNALNGQTPPPAQPSGSSDPVQGEKTYQAACARCHSQQGHKVTDPTYLAMVNNRTLRAIIIVGRPDLAIPGHPEQSHPDWRGDIPGRPLTGQEVNDIVAYLNSLRSDTPGQPYSTPKQ